MSDQTTQALPIEQYINDILGTIDREREREIVARRFGLFDRRETLEQIGELLGITRERVRQLEKAVVAKLKAAAEAGQLPHITEVQAALKDTIENLGGVARIQDISKALSTANNRVDQARIAFLAQLCPQLTVVEDNDHYHFAVGLKSLHDEKKIKERVAKIIEAVKNIGEPTDAQTIADRAEQGDAKHTEALASVSKQLATLNGRWGLIK